MSLLSDLINGKQMSLSDGSKITIAYKADANVLALTMSGTAILSDSDISKLQRIFGILKASKQLESQV